MEKIPPEIREQIADADPKVREAAAWQLRNYTGTGALKCLKQLLTDAQAEVRYAASAGMISIGGEVAAETVASLLRSQDPGLRNMAVEILAKIGKAAIDRVSEMLHDRDKDIRKFGVDILEKIGSTEAEALLVQALLDDNVNVSAAAAEALGKCGTKSAVPHLIACLDQSSWLKCAALRSLGVIGGDEALKAILGIDLKDESMVLFSAVSALGTLGDSRGIDFLLDLLDRGDRTLEPSIIQAIESIFNKSYVQKLTRVSQKIDPDKILPMLQSDNTETVRSAIGLLGLLRAESAVASLVKLCTESNCGLLEDLEQALLQIKPVHIQPIFDIVGNDREPDSVKQSAVRIIGALGRKEALDPLVSCLKTAGESLKTEIIRAISALDDQQAIKPLENLLLDPSDHVRLAAVEALKGFKAPSSIVALFKLKSEPSETVRTAAAKALKAYDLNGFKKDIAHLLGNQDTPAISFGLELLSFSMGHVFESEITKLCCHKDVGVRKLAVKAIGRLQSDVAFNAVAEAFSDTDESVRLTAIRAINGKDIEKSAQCLIEIAKTDSSDWNRYEAVQTICRLKLTQLQSKLLNLLKICPDLVKAAIMDTLGEWNSKEHAAIIKGYASVDNDLLRNAAIEALEKMGF